MRALAAALVCEVYAVVYLDDVIVEPVYRMSMSLHECLLIFHLTITLCGGIGQNSWAVPEIKKKNPSCFLMILGCLQFGESVFFRILITHDME